MISEQMLEISVAKQLKKIGLPVVKREVKVRTGNKIADLVAYTVGKEGKLSPEVVVEVKRTPSMDAQKALMYYAQSFQTKYALLATPEKNIWFDTATFLPIDEPTFDSEEKYIEAHTEIQKNFYEILDQIRGEMDLKKGWLLLLYSLLIRTYINETKKDTEWDLLNQSDFHQLTLEALTNYGMENAIEKIEISLRVYQVLIWKIGEVKVPSPPLGALLLHLLERNRELGEYITPDSVEGIFTGFVEALPLKEKNVLDMAVGYGTISLSLLQKGIDQLTSFEINKQVSNYFKGLAVISGYQVKVYSEDVLAQTSDLAVLPNVVLVDPPLGGRPNTDLYRHYHVINQGQRRSIDTPELFLEQSTNLVDKGGYVIALVPQSTMFSKKSQITREFMKEKMIIEAIVSLPPHALKPYTGIKTSLLLMRRKLTENETAKEVFLAKCDSVDQFPEVIKGYKEWKNGGEV